MYSVLQTKLTIVSKISYIYKIMGRGTIFSIEEFAINDGPGIRTTIFLKGCPLRCAWCHNPEGLSFRPQLMHKFDGDEICGYVIEADDLYAKLHKDKEFFAMNDGGVTFTGGEPTAQPEFLLEMLDRLEDIHTAVETSGHCPEEIFRQVADKADYILFDVKHCDPDIHKRWTGVDNSLILKNLETLCACGKEFVVRIPLIPGVNDSVKNMSDTADLLKGAVNLKRVELLRYHRTAGAKYSMVDKEYAPGFDTEAEPQVHIEPFEANNIKTIIL